MGFIFFFNSILIGAGLAMDAFSVSLADGLAEPAMPKRKHLLIALTFAIYQTLMPFIGWFFVHAAVETFSAITVAIPWIALLLLSFIGGKMLFEGIREVRCHNGETEYCTPKKPLGIAALLVQGLATSIDALSVGFTIAEYTLTEALICVLLIGIVTLLICGAGISLGKRFGTAFAGKSTVLGGAILILIGLEIFITSFF